MQFSFGLSVLIIEAFSIISFTLTSIINFATFNSHASCWSFVSELCTLTSMDVFLLANKYHTPLNHYILT